MEISFSRGNPVWTSKRVCISCNVLGSFVMMMTESGRFIIVLPSVGQESLPVQLHPGQDRVLSYQLVSLMIIFLFFNSSMKGSSGTHCSGGSTPRSAITPFATICAMIDVGKAVVRIIDVMFNCVS